MSDFLEAVARAFDDLISSGKLTVESSQYDERAFGNAVVVLGGTAFRMRLRRDRGDISADVASVTEPSVWFPLERVLQAVDVLGVRLEGLLSPSEAADLVRTHVRALEAGFSVARLDKTRLRLEEFHRQRLAEALSRFSKAPDVAGG